MRRLAQLAGICQTVVLLSACLTGFTAVTLLLWVSFLTSFVVFEAASSVGGWRRRAWILGR